MSRIIRYLFNLQRGEEDKQKTLDAVKSNISFTGSNLWILVCAIIVASIGLNVNSTAVIIGAMLISPLMGPIIGAGFALGMYDFKLLKRSLLNLLIATVASLIVAFIYFYISPFKQIQSELLARTSPNIYDVLIAFFGGVVGVIAITRKEKGNPIPGVAIATALMPPLCTAGYGLATGNIRFFLGALFLYIINCVFICIATFSIVKYLKYPAVQQVDEKQQKQVKYSITLLVVFMLLPSAYFAFSLFKEQQFKQSAENFISKEFLQHDNTVVYQKISYNNPSRTIELALLKKKFTNNEIRSFNNKLASYGLQNTKLIIVQDSGDNLQALKNDILNEVKRNGGELDEKDKQIALLKDKINEGNFDNKQLYSEANALFPAIKAIALAKQNLAKADTNFMLTTLYYEANPQLSTQDKSKLKNWISKKLSTGKIELLTTDK
ncbi:TIGR00341 family protein [Pedobacter sp.]|uniref:TIGR00341 family protein n=1 Tax=Pedobacter sp. TaxID=1411316 RepID=UPI00396CE7A7